MSGPRRREGLREYLAEDRADAALARWINAQGNSMTEDDNNDQPQGDDIVEHALLTAQKHGQAKLPEMIEVVDALIVQRCSSARANIHVPGHASAWDWAVWGRTTYVFEALLSFLQRIDKDPEAKDYLVRRFRREVIRGDEKDRKIPVDNSGD